LTDYREALRVERGKREPILFRHSNLCTAPGGSAAVVGGGSGEGAEHSGQIAQQFCETFADRSRYQRVRYGRVWYYVMYGEDVIANSRSKGFILCREDKKHQHFRGINE